MPLDSGDRVLDWREEMLRVAPRLYELPDAARRAVLGAVGAFLSEDADELNEALMQSVRQAARELADAA
ncbi:MAG: hypothetical protein ABSB24_06910 [Gaiellaceae bacterium]